jgi:hypothetical protein
MREPAVAEEGVVVGRFMCDPPGEGWEKNPAFSFRLEEGKSLFPRNIFHQNDSMIY